MVSIVSACLLAAGVPSMTGCGDATVTTDATVATDVPLDLAAESGIDTVIVPEVVDALQDGVVDTAVDGQMDATVPLSSLCPPAGPPGSGAGVVPRPWQFHDLGEPISFTALAVNGSTAEEAQEVQSIAERAGVLVAVDGGWPVRLMDADRWSALAAACGFPNDLAAGAYYLRTDSDGAYVFAADVDGRFHALKTLKQLIVAGKAQVQSAAVLDQPAVAIRGYGESYYGEPWAPENRLAMIPIMADLKCNYYMYAPKFDLAISTFWAYPFTDEMLAHLQAITTLAHRNRMHTCMQLHPQGVRFSVPDDYDSAIAKFHAAAAQGFDCFVLAFDDSEKKLAPEDLSDGRTFVQMQVEWSRRIGEELHAAYPDALLGFVPNDYWSGAEGVSTDLKYVGSNLEAYWKIAWTGPEVGSRSITAADADAIAVVIQRKPFLADNHPVVDNTQYSGVMNLAPLERRAGDLADHVEGLIYNPMPLAFASLPGLATAIDFAWNPAGYDPERSLTAVGKWMVGADATPAFETLCRANYSPYSNSSPAPALEDALPAFWTEHAARTPQDVSEGPAALALRSIFVGYAAVPAGLERANGDMPGFLSEVKPWSDKLGIEGAAGLLALDLLGRKSVGIALDPAELAQLKAARAGLSSSVAKPTGQLMPDFLTSAIAMLDGTL